MSKPSTKAKLAIIELKDSIKASCDQPANVCNNCDCWLDLLDGEPIGGCEHAITNEDNKGIIACLECGDILESSDLLNEYLLKVQE